MTTLVVLFNLRPGVSREEYEKFAREVDLPIVNALGSVARFEVLRTGGLLGGGQAPYQYVELLRLNSLEQLGKDVATAKMQEVSAKFRQLADDPKFMVTELL